MCARPRCSQRPSVSRPRAPGQDRRSRRSRVGRFDETPHGINRKYVHGHSETFARGVASLTTASPGLHHAPRRHSGACLTSAAAAEGSTVRVGKKKLCKSVAVMEADPLQSAARMTPDPAISRPAPRCATLPAPLTLPCTLKPRPSPRPALPPLLADMFLRLSMQCVTSWACI